MKTLPLAARWYLVVVWCVAASLIGHILLSSPILLDQLPLLLLWIILFAFGDYFEVSIGVSPEHRALLTITDTAMIFLVAVAGPLGMLVTALGTYIVGLLRRHLWYRNLFNVAQRSIDYQIMLLVYILLSVSGPLPFTGAPGRAFCAAGQRRAARQRHSWGCSRHLACSAMHYASVSSWPAV